MEKSRENLKRKSKYVLLVSKHMHLEKMQIEK